MNKPKPKSRQDMLAGESGIALLKGGAKQKAAAKRHRPTDAHAIHAAKVGKGGLAQQVTKAAAERKRRPAQTNGYHGAAGATFGEISVPKVLVGEGEAPAEPAVTGTSIFDPVLCELVYRWFCPPGGLVLDPFAGGSVRGIVASRLGRRYLGIDLRAEQVRANEAQAATIAGDPRPQWLIGDARDLIERAAEIGDNADLIFSCPPYGDLEVYSDDPLDLSAMPHDQFDEALAEIVGQACQLLAPDRFAAFVVGDYRDELGFYRNLPGRTVAAFEAAGLRLYNEAILVTAVGSLPVRARKQFVASRKLGKTHQNLLVFVKGDPRAAAAAVGTVQFGNVDFLDQPEGGENRQAAPSGSPAPLPETAPAGLERVPATPLGGEI